MVRVRRLLAGSSVTLALLATVMPRAAPATPAAGATGHVTTVESVVVPVETVVISRSGTESTRYREVGGDDAVEPFTMIGAAYTAPSGGPGRVRVLVDGHWTRWFPLVGVEPSGDHGPDATTGEGNRLASEPIWVGAGEGFEISLPEGTTGVTVHLVRDSEVPGGPGSGPVEAAPGPPPATEAGGYSPPPVRPRTDWGAAPYRGSVDVATGLTRAVVHHTVNGNGYSAGQVPSMLRSIQAYHQNSRGWDDIGYNFVIDRFGTVWEGRASSLYQPVIGAHASDANEGSVGVAYLGDGTTTGLTSSAVTALGRFLGWKLPLHGARPSRTNIVGHRDVGQTACPGNTVYGQLGAIRSKAIALAAPVGPFFDVPEGDRRATHLGWGRATGVVDARLDGTFGPAAPVSRADNLYWLWRFAGEPDGTAPHGFTDIPTDAYYREAVRWARAEGIVRMTANAEFDPDATVTRQSAALQLWRYAGSPDPSVHHTYTDVPDGVDSEAGYDWADAYGLVTSRAFGRTVRVTRSESVDLLYRLRPYLDVPERHFARAAIDWARFHVIATGFAGNRFQPSDGVTRIQGANWLWRTMDRPATPANDPFGDDDESAWYADALDAAAHAGWVDAADPDTPTAFVPGGVMTRGDATRWLWHMAGDTAVTYEHPFTDVPGPSELDDAVDWAKGFNLVNGFPDGEFKPADPITRAQFLRMIHRLANRPNAWAVTPPSTVEF